MISAANRLKFAILWRHVEEARKKERETTGQKYNVRICYPQGGHNKLVGGR